MSDEADASTYLIALTAEIVTAHVANNRLPTTELPGLISAVHAALAGLGGAEAPAASSPEHAPAVSVRKSLSNPNFIVSMIDGKEYKSLNRHQYAGEVLRLSPGTLWDKGQWRVEVVDDCFTVITLAVDAPRPTKKPFAHRPDDRQAAIDPAHERQR